MPSRRCGGEVRWNVSPRSTGATARVSSRRRNSNRRSSGSRRSSRTPTSWRPRHGSGTVPDASSPSMRCVPPTRSNSPPPSSGARTRPRARRSSASMDVCGMLPAGKASRFYPESSTSQRPTDGPFSPACLHAELRVESVTQPVADEVDAESRHMRPSQKPGTACLSTVASVPAWSRSVSRRTAETTPSGTASTRVRTHRRPSPGCRSA